MSTKLPTMVLLCKLGSIAVHAEEMLEDKALGSKSNSFAFDKSAIMTLLKDPDVLAWMAEMRASALLPVKR